MSAENNEKEIGESFLKPFINSLSEKIEEIITRTKPAPSRFYEGVADEIIFTDKKKPKIPNFMWENTVIASEIALTQIDIVFNDTIDDTFKPHCQIMVGGSKIFSTLDTAKNPFRNADLTLDLKNGLILEQGRTVDIFLWHTGSSIAPKSATVFISTRES